MLNLDYLFIRSIRSCPATITHQYHDEFDCVSNLCKNANFKRPCISQQQPLGQGVNEKKRGFRIRPLLFRGTSVVRAASPLPLLGNKALFLSNTSAALLVQYSSICNKRSSTSTDRRHKKAPQSARIHTDYSREYSSVLAYGGAWLLPRVNFITVSCGRRSSQLTTTCCAQ